MESISGVELADGSEISEVQYRPVDEVLKDPHVVSLTQEILRLYIREFPKFGLCKIENSIQTNNKYINYDVYTLT
jgi:hypothetical protein